MTDSPAPSATDDVPVYDFVVIGGGSAGYAAARTAVSLGLKTAVVEGGRDIGGLCILRGCMPSKTMIESANRFVTLRRAREFGLRAENIRVVPEEVQARKRRLVGEFAGYRRGQLEHGKFDFIRGLARFIDEHHLEILPPEETRTTSAPSRTASRRALSSSPLARTSPTSTSSGLPEAGFITSDEALELEAYPESLIVLGAGAIGLEAAHQFAGLGTQVTVIQRGTHIMRGTDEDVAGALQTGLANQGIRFHCCAHLLRVELDPSDEQQARLVSRAAAANIP